MSQVISRISLIYGAAGFGAAGTGTKVNDLPTAQTLLHAFLKSGHHGVDTSALYGLGSSEDMLGQMDLQNARIDTKLYPLAPGDFAPTKFRELFQRSLKALRGHKIRVFYLHAADRSVPFEDTLEVVNDLHNEGHFEEFGLSNFNSWEVAEVYQICKYKGYILPTVYEGVYNMIDRTTEVELFPCLCKFGIRFAAYSPLAGGFLVGIYLDADPTKDVEPGSHFDPSLPFGQWFQARYVRMIPAVRELRDKCTQHGLNLNEVSARWLQHHSVLTPADHGIIFGGSKVHQIEKTLEYNSKGPLPEDLVLAIEEMYVKVKEGLPHYALGSACMNWYYS